MSTAATKKKVRKPKHEPKTLFRVRAGSHFHQRDADIIGPELQRLDAEGKLSASEMAKVARDPNNPLHQYYDWDQDRVFDKYLEQRSREIINSVTITIIIEEESGEKLNLQPRAFILKQTDNKPAPGKTKSYIDTTRAMKDQVEWEAQVDAAYRDLLNWRDRYEVYRRIYKSKFEAFEPVFVAIEQVIGKKKSNAA